MTMVHNEVLGELLQLYAEARRKTDQSAAISAADPDIGDPVMEICRYCAGKWQRWEGARFDGHAACVVTEEFKLQLAFKLRDQPQISLNQVAQVLDVGKGAIRSWHQVGLQRLAVRERGIKKKERDTVIRVWEQVSPSKEQL